MLVLFEHAHDVLLVNYPVATPASHHPLLLRLFYPLISAGTQAVNIFFVLSGYLVSGSIFRSLAGGQWSWRRYLTHRLVRLWVVLGPALLLCTFWDGLRLARSGGPPALIAAWTLRRPYDGLTAQTFTSNLFFLQTLYTRTFGSDRPLWSLAPEFWYYLLFPLVLLAWRRETARRARAGYALGALAVAAFMGRGVLALFPVWLLGVALVKLPPRPMPRLFRWVAALVYAPTVFTLATLPWPYRYFKQDYVCGVLTTLFLWTVLSARAPVREQTLPVQLTRRLAGFSYSLYLVHFPLLAFLATYLVHGALWQPTGQHLLALAAVCAVILLYAAGVAALTEERTDTVRRWVERQLRLTGMPVRNSLPDPPRYN